MLKNYLYYLYYLSYYYINIFFLYLIMINYDNENIAFELEDDELKSDDDISLSDIVNHLDNIDDIELNNGYHDNIMETINYKENYTVKQLMIICEYYEISKNILVFF